ncbi:hypothetical protein DICSQDRAFT_175363 [Dichomitus squalens LYAD-421 SS1]|uniref:Uncharacterized protein n=1 Tax=Dichomitus squalens (strain LYAD-421) TaxID=732165 RepID=R7SIF1_DICSQ|nr:uncharacterized protein DICSQDRAFT_175363 [Dichomitus squalens LYAD-421 SS1]EJF55929.1 hypothetical protein DICSQDRAFT_175363 [Dichomitus squalens LYAD-421 SS1]
MVSPPSPSSTPQTPSTLAEVIGKRPHHTTTEGLRKKGPGDNASPTEQPETTQPRLIPESGTHTVNTVATSEPRPTCTMPSRAPQGTVNVLPLLKFDPTDFAGLPTVQGENPHIQQTRRGPTPTLLKQTTRIYTDVEFPHAYIPA